MSSGHQVLYYFYPIYGHERGAGLSPVPNPSVTLGSEVCIEMSRESRELATGGTISIVAARG
jgi:hypothetical protein